ncbi:hypothetical protein ES708_16708 [subsurface metagenome]
MLDFLTVTEIYLFCQAIFGYSRYYHMNFIIWDLELYRNLIIFYSLIITQIVDNKKKN